MGCAELLGETALRVHDLVGNLSEDKLAILALAKNAQEEAARGSGSSSITSEQVMEELKIGANTARQKLARMVKEGHLQRLREGEFTLAIQGWQANPFCDVTRHTVTPVTAQEQPQALGALQRDTVTRDSRPICLKHSAPTLEGHCARCELEMAS